MAVELYDVVELRPDVLAGTLTDAVFAASLDAALTYDVQVGVALSDPAHRLKVSFIGPPREYQPLKPALDHLLGQHEASVKAEVIGSSGSPLDLSGQTMENLRRRAQDTGPAKCKVSHVTEPG